MFNLLLYVAMPLLLISVGLGWWASNRTLLISYKVLVGQLMIDSLILAVFLLMYFDLDNLMYLAAAAFYSAILSMRLRELFTKVDKEIRRNTNNPPNSVK